jgi:hypothetical protein
MFLANQWFIFVIFLLCCPSQRSNHIQVPSKVATHQGMEVNWGWGDARFEPGTAGQQSGALPLSYLTSIKQ